MKKLQYYTQLEYPIRIEPDPDGGFVASIPDLPGCYSYGDTKQESIEKLEESKAAWLESYHSMHGEAPEPANAQSFSGRVLMRMPKHLHKRLNETAREEGVSINQYLVALVAEGICRGELARSNPLSVQKKYSEKKSRELRVGESSRRFNKRNKAGKNKPAGDA
jgi:antitoxin HicB